MNIMACTLHRRVNLLGLFFLFLATLFKFWLHNKKGKKKVLVVSDDVEYNFSKENKPKKGCCFFYMCGGINVKLSAIPDWHLKAGLFSVQRILSCTLLSDPSWREVTSALTHIGFSSLELCQSSCPGRGCSATLSAAWLLCLRWGRVTRSKKNSVCFWQQR